MTLQKYTFFSFPQLFVDKKFFRLSVFFCFAFVVGGFFGFGISCFEVTLLLSVVYGFAPWLLAGFVDHGCILLCVTRRRW